MSGKRSPVGYRGAEMEGGRVARAGSFCRASTMLTLRWLRFTLSTSGGSGKAVPAPKSSLYWIFLHGGGVKAVSSRQPESQHCFTKTLAL